MRLNFIVLYSQAFFFLDTLPQCIMLLRIFNFRQSRCVCAFMYGIFFLRGGGGGGLIFGPGIFLDFDFCAHSIILVT